ncbi:hypothetical protein AVEN_237234-1 [Araneus ventricosus]|uniref:Uncharacterized protein n=1 Tax=Araneus ventricosus TaxID=182803 RepID=A0A4Y2VE03_ARAVE|nr:hypothetical protein AVEN_237234-1 [Araneus ventricosus]
MQDHSGHLPWFAQENDNINISLLKERLQLATAQIAPTTYDEFIDSGKLHFLQDKREPPWTYVIHHRLAILLNTRGTDVLNLELDKPKIKHSSRGVFLSCPGKDYLLAIRGTDVDPHRSP